MPYIDRDKRDRAFTFSSNTPTLPGTYHASSIAMSQEAALGNGSIKVEIGTIGLIEAGSNNLLWTDSLKSCFPVVFKFRNGDIALYHGNNAALDTVMPYLSRNDLFEIQLFEKGTNVNTGKVREFIRRLIAHYEKKDAPSIQIEAGTNPYTAVVCQHINNDSLIFIGETSAQDSIITTRDDFANHEDNIFMYQFISGQEKLSQAQDLQRTMKKTLTIIAADKDNHDPDAQKPCCIIM